MRGISGLAEELLAYEEGLCPMELSYRNGLTKSRSQLGLGHNHGLGFKDIYDNRVIILLLRTVYSA